MDKMKDDVLRKLGRNVLLFQEAEHLLKWMGARQKISYGPEGWNGALAESVQTVGKDTLGGVASRAIKGPVPDTDSEVEKVVAEQGFHMATTTEIGGDDEFVATRKARLERLVEARNDLVHQFYARFDLQTEEGCGKAERYLDDQYAEHLKAVENIRREREAVGRVQEMAAAFLKQEPIKNEFLYGWVREVRLVKNLKAAVTKHARDDGWTSLSVGGDELAQEDPKVMDVLRQKFGYQGLRQAVIATGMFEVREEPTEGGSRLMFRES